MLLKHMKQCRSSKLERHAVAAMRTFLKPGTTSHESTPWNDSVSSRGSGRHVWIDPGNQIASTTNVIQFSAATYIPVIRDADQATQRGMCATHMCLEEVCLVHVQVVPGPTQGSLNLRCTGC